MWGGVDPALTAPLPCLAWRVEVEGRWPPPMSSCPSSHPSPPQAPPTAARPRLVSFLHPVLTGAPGVRVGWEEGAPPLATEGFLWAEKGPAWRGRVE